MTKTHSLEPSAGPKASLEKPPKSPPNSLKEQVAGDIRSHLARYRSQAIGLRKLSEKSGLHQRTLKRLLSQENRAGYQTLIRLYTCLLESGAKGLALETLPERVAQEIKAKAPESNDRVAAYNEEANREMLYDKVFAEIYCLASMSPVTRELVRLRYGMSGLETLERMTRLRALRPIGESAYTTGEVEIEFTPELVKRLGLNLAQKYGKTKDAELAGSNVMSFYAEGLSQEGYQAWLKIDEEAFYKKLQITKKEGMLGNIKAFTFMATDTMNLK